MIDLHSHILPGLDDGPADLDEAVALARAASTAGIRVVATTSHIHRSFMLDPDDLDAARAELAERLAREGVPVELVQGGEISTGRLPDLDDDTLGRLALGGGRWVLLECPFSAATAMEPMTTELQRRGFGVLLAHPERSAYFQRDPRRLGRLVEQGALAQVTAGSFAGEFGDVPRRTAYKLLETGWVHVLASDAHSAYDRGPSMREGIAALRSRYGDVAAQVTWMAEQLPAAILSSAQPPPRPALPRPRSMLRRLRAA